MHLAQHRILGMLARLEEPRDEPKPCRGRPWLRTSTMQPARSTIGRDDGHGIAPVHEAAARAREPLAAAVLGPSRARCGRAGSSGSRRRSSGYSIVGVRRGLARGETDAARRSIAHRGAWLLRGRSRDRARAQPSGEAIYAAHCAGCHDAPPSEENRAPPRALLKQMSVARIVRTMDFGAMMSLTYMLDRAEREAVARISACRARIASRRRRRTAPIAPSPSRDGASRRLERLEPGADQHALSVAAAGSRARRCRSSAALGVRLRGRRQCVRAAGRARRAAVRRQRGRLDLRARRAQRLHPLALPGRRSRAHGDGRRAARRDGAARRAVRRSGRALLRGGGRERRAACGARGPRSTSRRSSRARRSRTTASSTCRWRRGRRAGR